MTGDDPNEAYEVVPTRTSRRTVLWAFSNLVVQPETPALDDRIFKPYGVREAGWISLSGCQQNRVQLNVSAPMYVKSTSLSHNSRIDVMKGWPNNA